MSNREDREKRERRFSQENTKVKRQTRIARAAGLDVREEHRFSKHHALDCGNPKCPLCGNPRKNGQTKDKLTAQEKRLFQDVEKVRDVHSNGLVPEDFND